MDVIQNLENIAQNQTKLIAAKKKKNSVNKNLVTLQSLLQTYYTYWIAKWGQDK